MTTGGCEIKETRSESGIMRLQSFSSLLRFVTMRSGPHCVSFILTVACWTRSIRQTCERLCFCLCALQYGMGGSGGSKSSFTPFVDPRVYGTSPTDDDDDNISASGTFPLSLTIAATWLQDDSCLQKILNLFIRCLMSIYHRYICIHVFVV